MLQIAQWLKLPPGASGSSRKITSSFANMGAAVGPMLGAFTGIYGFQWIFLIASFTSILFAFVTRQTGAAFTLYIFNLNNVNLLDLGIVYSLNGLLAVCCRLPSG